MAPTPRRVAAVLCVASVPALAFLGLRADGDVSRPGIAHSVDAPAPRVPVEVDVVVAHCMVDDQVGETEAMPTGASAEPGAVVDSPCRARAADAAAAGSGNDLDGGRVELTASTAMTRLSIWPALGPDDRACAVAVVVDALLASDHEAVTPATLEALVLGHCDVTLRW